MGFICFPASFRLSYRVLVFIAVNGTASKKFCIANMISSFIFAA